MKRQYPLYINKLSPCYSRDHLGNHGCYARNDIPRFLYLITLGRFEEAFYVLKETNPFSSGCGRFCDHPCETACNRTKFDQPVDIRAMERFISDWGYENGLQPKKKANANGKQVAVIGSGPAGLSCAYFLAVNGYKVDVYEKFDRAGGLLTEGIPEYRYPREIFAKELAFIQAAGVTIHTNAQVNKNKFLNLAQEYDAVVVATGAHKPVDLNIEGEDLPEVWHGIDFLRHINYGTVEELNIQPGERIGIIGGGYSSIDVARSAVRLGAQPKIVYRRTESEMTAHAGEVADTVREGVSFKFLRQPVKIEKKKGVLRLTTQVMKLGPVDESGRSKPVPMHGEFEVFEFDRVVMAVGDRPDLFYVGERFSVDFPRMICPDLPEDVRNRVFIAGDAAMGSVEGTGMVVRVVGLAQDTAKGVREFLGEKLDDTRPWDIAYYKTLNTKYFEKTGRMAEEEISFEERKGNFKEIVKTAGVDLAMLMSSRCFNCGICIQCDWCYHYSNGSIIKVQRGWVPDKDAHFYQFVDDSLQDATFSSVEACPRSALSVIKEGSRLDEVRKGQYIPFDVLTGGEE